MGPLIPFVMIALAVGSGLHDASVKQYDAPKPQRCATFQDRYSVDNRAFCDAWMAAHRRKPHQEPRS